MQKTPWFNAAKQKPVRSGVYETRCIHGYADSFALRWNAKQRAWFWRDDNSKSTYGQSCDYWRGLKEKT